MTKIRFKVLKWWIKGNTNDVSFREICNFFFAQSYSKKAKDKIIDIKESGDYNLYYLSGIERPLYYPKALSKRSLEQVIVESFYKNNWHYYQIDQTKVGANDVVVDCGAAEGLFSLMVASICRKVYVIEPLPIYLESLRMTFSGCDSVVIVPCALSDKQGKAFISPSGVTSSLSMNNIGHSVRVETIDTLFYEKDIQISYIKADLEGHDFEMIMGAKNTIRKYGPKIAITTYHAAEHAKQISEFIVGLNPKYKIRIKGIYQETGSPVMLHAWCEH